MHKIKLILSLCKTFLNEQQLEQLENILEIVLNPTHCDKTDEAVVDAFIKHCKFRNLSDSTIEVETAAVRAFVQSLNCPLLEATADDVKSFLGELASRGVSAVTLNIKRSYLASFYKFLLDEDWITDNPMRKVPRCKTAHYQKDSFSETDILVLLQACTNLRDRAMVELLLSSGIRVSELINLNIGDVDLTNCTAFIRQGKGKKDRVVALSKSCARTLTKYLLQRSDRNADAPLVATLGKHGEILNGRLKRNSVEVWFLRTGEKHHIANCHPHTCRHYCLTTMIRKQIPLKLVSMQAGHASIKTTVDVYDNQTQEEMFAAYNAVMN